MAPIVYKCERFDEHDDEEGQSLDKDEDNGDKDRYVLLPPTTLFLPPQKSQNVCQI